MQQARGGVLHPVRREIRIGDDHRHGGRAELVGDLHDPVKPADLFLGEGEVLVSAERPLCGESGRLGRQVLGEER